MKIQYADKPALLGNPTDFLPGETIDLGGGVFAVQKPNGMYLSVQPDGTYQERPSAGGSYERFTLDTDKNAMNVKPRVLTYPIAITEV